MALLFNADAERAKVFAGAFAHALPHLPFLTGTIPDTLRPHQAGPCSGRSRRLCARLLNTNNEGQ